MKKQDMRKLVNQFKKSLGEDLNETSVKELFDPTASLPNYTLPSLDLLSKYENHKFTSVGEIESNEKKIRDILCDFGIKPEDIKLIVGHTVLLYEIKTNSPVRRAKIEAFENEIILRLKVPVRVIVDSNEDNTIGIEIPRLEPSIVSMRSVLSSETYQNTDMELPIAIGKTVRDEVFMIDLAKEPHLLVAGATGKGKSCFMESVITSLLYKKHPSMLKFVIFDPKNVEFTAYEAIKNHYLAQLPGKENAIVTDMESGVATLKSLAEEMDNRYILLADARARNIKEYNEAIIHKEIDTAKELKNGLKHRFLPYIVTLIDEYGDYMLTSGREFEMLLARIAQKSRAVGIHLVISTQRPSVKIITAAILANFSTRIAYKVASKSDSLNILQNKGAENLVGMGDMIYSLGNVFQRVQTAYISFEEQQGIIRSIVKQDAFEEPYQLPEVSEPEQVVVPECLDPLLKSVVDKMLESQSTSTTFMMQTFYVGFNRASRIMDQLEYLGIVGPFTKDSGRQLLIKDMRDYEKIIGNLNSSKNRTEDSNILPSVYKKNLAEFTDPLFADVANYIVGLKWVQISVIQRQFNISFDRAGKLIDELSFHHFLGEYSKEYGYPVLIGSKS